MSGTTNTAAGGQGHQYAGAEQGAHTPGPWNWHEYDGAGSPYILVKNGSWDIAHNRHSAVDLETERANARLIAAAPDMLEACKRALDALIAHADLATQYEQELLAAAIAKASASRTEDHQTTAQRE